MIRAINRSGQIAEFSERVWNMSKNHNGWVQWDGVKEINVPSEVTEFQLKKKADAVVEVKIVPVETQSDQPVEKSESEITAEMDRMKKELDSKGVKYHYRIGYGKLKALYHDHS